MTTDRGVGRCPGCGAWKANRAPCGVCDRADQPTAAPATNAWMDSAACRDHDTALWFAETDSPEQRAALAICRACPVREPCLAHAVHTPEPLGTWGGRTEWQRARTRGRVRPRR